MKVIEEYILGRDPDQQYCEDVIVVTDDFIAAIDGVSSKIGTLFNGMKGGKFAAVTVAEAIKNMPGDVSCRQAVDLMTEHLLSETLRVHGESLADMPGVNLVMYSRHRKEIWSIGDCSFMVDDSKHLGGKKLDDVMLEARAMFVETQLRSGLSEDEIRNSSDSWQFIFPLLSKQYLFVNLDEDHDLAYPNLNGSYMPDRFLEVYPVSEAKEIVLATDGYPDIFHTLEESEKYLEKDLKDDPLRIGVNKGFRPVSDKLLSFDDRAYIRFTV